MLGLHDQVTLTANALRNLAKDMAECQRDIPERFISAVAAHAKGLSVALDAHAAPLPSVAALDRDRYGYPATVEKREDGTTVTTYTHDQARAAGLTWAGPAGTGQYHPESMPPDLAEVVAAQRRAGFSNAGGMHAAAGNEPTDDSPEVTK